MKMITIILITLASLNVFADVLAKDICQGIHGKNDKDLVNYCLSAYGQFTQEQKFVQMAEKSKKIIAGAPSLLKKITDVASTIIEEAKNNKALAAQEFVNSGGILKPEFGLNDAVGGGVTCDFSYDPVSDEDMIVIKGEYSCQLRAGVWINYQSTDCAVGPNTLKTEQEELMINFIITKDGIRPITVETKPLTVTSSCAG